MKHISLPVILLALLFASQARAGEVNPNDAAMKAAIGKLGKSIFLVDKTEAAAGELVSLGQNALPYLLKKLDSASEIEAALAASAIGKLGDKSTFEKLKKVLTESDSVAVRLFSVRALAELGDARAVPVLIKRLDDEKSKRVYRFVCHALGDLKSDDAVTPLSKALDSGEDAAATALGKIGNKAALPALGRALKAKSEWISLVSARAIATFQTQEAHDMLIAAVRGENWNAARSASIVLGEKKDRTAIEAISSAVRKSSSIDVRVAAVQALGKIAYPAGEAAILAALEKDKSAKVRAMAAWSLGELGLSNSIENLVSALSDGSPMVREAARVALAGKFPTSSVSALTEAYKSDDTATRLEVTRTLAQIATREAKKALEPALKDTDPAIRKIAENALSTKESK
ncbi:MAG: HEAT repeat domain-containing protein [Planctomycetota bacterium]|nr:MAG: HEAT repeat domain-containing protein [Planctomycetota bacterium]